MKGTAATDFFHFEYVRVLGMTPMHGADVAECLEADSKIKHNDPESWYRAWTAAAEGAEALAKESLVKGDKESARWAFLRASNYRRASEFMLHVSPTDSRLLKIISQSTDNFKKACALFDSPVEMLEIPYEKYQLPAYLYLPNGAQKIEGKLPVVLCTGGFDSIQEEIYYLVPAGARTRGYAALSFDGPGQGLPLRRDKLPMRPDWEVVISAVLDSLFEQSKAHPEWNLDLSRIALTGSSMGGHFALRGALDPRIGACVCSDSFYDFGNIVRSRTPFFWKYLSDGVADRILNIVGKLKFQSRLEFGHGTLTFGDPSPSKAFRKFGDFTLEPNGEKLLSRIKCPVLITGAKDTLYPLETSRIYDGLTQLAEGSQKELWEPVGWGNGGFQAKVAALSHLQAKLFSFLDRVFEVNRGDIVNINGIKGITNGINGTNGTKETK